MPGKWKKHPRMYVVRYIDPGLGPGAFIFRSKRDAEREVAYLRRKGRPVHLDVLAAAEVPGE